MTANDGISDGSSQQRYADFYQNNLHMTAELVPKFSGQDSTYPVSKWIQDIEDTGEIFKWAPLQQLLVARRSLIGTAELWLKSERPFMSWEELKSEISKEFPSTLDAKAVHEVMSARKKKRNESCLDYLLIMKEMGKRGKLADYITIKYIIDGIIDHESNKIMLYGIKTYSELKEKLKIYEMVKSKTLERPQYEQRNNYQHGEQRTYSKKNVRCYNCGDLGHSSYGCPNKGKGIKCFKCNDFGHISTACNKKSSNGTQFEIKDGGHRKYVNRFDNRISEPKKSELQADTSQRTMFGSLDTTANFTSNGGGNEQSMICQNEEQLMSNVNVIKEVMKIVNKDDKLKNIQCKPVKKVIINKTEVNALIDSGSDVNLISENY
ncbi:PREDICTED: uncharacterized protein LOC106109531, partial [Papilio polytes]|uniref:uncharacterized protein LOC106109531 n=1 Tax=Papilio polytes TaxID=76194 RepID=UPI0006764241